MSEINVVISIFLKTKGNGIIYGERLNSVESTNPFIHLKARFQNLVKDCKTLKFIGTESKPLGLKEFLISRNPTDSNFNPPTLKFY